MKDLRDSGLHHLREEVDHLGEKLARIESPIARDRLRDQIDLLRRRIDALMLPIEARIYERYCRPGLEGRLPIAYRERADSYRRQRP